jgi:hypothetical protein
MRVVGSLDAAPEAFSPPPSGEGLGVGVSFIHIHQLCGLPPSLTLPRKGGGKTKTMLQAH